MDRKKLPKDCDILYFYIVYSEIMSRSSAIIIKAFSFKGALWEEIFV